MTPTLSISALRRHQACSLAERLTDLCRVIPDVGEDDPVPLRVWWDLQSTSVSDRWWSLRAAEPEMDARCLGVRAAAADGLRAPLQLGHVMLHAPGTADHAPGSQGGGVGERGQVDGDARRGAVGDGHGSSLSRTCQGVALALRKVDCCAAHAGIDSP